MTEKDYKVQILTCCPLSLGNVGTPSLPVGGAFAVLLETLLLFAEVFLILNENHRDCRIRCEWAFGSVVGRESGAVSGARSGVEINNCLQAVWGK